MSSVELDNLVGRMAVLGRAYGASMNSTGGLRNVTDFGLGVGVLAIRERESLHPMMRVSTTIPVEVKGTYNSTVRQGTEQMGVLFCHDVCCRMIIFEVHYNILYTRTNSFDMFAHTSIYRLYE